MRKGKGVPHALDWARKKELVHGTCREAERHASVVGSTNSNARTAGRLPVAGPYGTSLV